MDGFCIELYPGRKLGKSDKGFSQSRFLAMRNMASAEVLQQERITAKYVDPISLQGSESQTISYRGSGLNKNVSWGFSKDMMYRSVSQCSLTL